MLAGNRFKIYCQSFHQISMMEQDCPQEKRSEQGEEMTEESFLKDLYLFMKQRDTPIERIPHLGFKQIDMFLMYKTVKELGGYQQVTAQQLWKKVYNILGGNPRSTSAATCTRRHYEKLLLPFECHQNGYRDDIVFRTPRSQKRFHPSSYSDYSEHEYPRNGKRADFRHLPAFPQPSPSPLFTEHQRQIFSMPLNVAPYFPHGSTSLPNYMALRESAVPHLSLSPSQDLPRPPPSYLGTPSVEVQSCKQPLDRLRHLAKEYKSSAGWEEPLNLSRKENRLDTLSDTPSSFSPPSKKPKFLNEASPLYPPRGLTSEEGAEKGETEDKTSLGEGGAGSVQAGPSPVSADIIDLTSSSTANPVPRRASPPSVNLFNRRMNYSEALAMKAREREPHADWLKEESSGAPKLGIVNRSNPFGPPPVDPNGNMEIQIPLKLLQELIRRGLLSNPAFMASSHASQLPTKAEAQPEHKFHVRSRSETSESSTTGEEPTNLSLKSPLRNLSDATPPENGMKKFRLFGGNGIPAESKLQMINSFHVNSSDVPRPFQPKQGQASKHQESMIPRLPSYSEDSPLSLTMKPGRKSEKVMGTSNGVAKEISTSPPSIQVTSENLKLLLASLPYRLERGQTF
ncbi:AT-rich interactive domain-containing 3A-like protein [Labeo rohita]|uniref:AT-rich interactive domain-containing 3A-like protein n=1 Tax=Labeo rohita TaxID=84645 RepID=A0A498LZH2_LABRO|nr:AT-rich interactive domain-containing 3A-like protein [Labeo rohita]